MTASVTAGKVVELDARALSATEVNEPLVNWCSLHGAEALAAVRSSDGVGHEATDRELLVMSGLVARCVGLRAHPAATASLVGLVAATRGRRPRLDPRRPHVAVITAERR